MTGDLLIPRDAADLLEIVRDAAENQTPLEILGHGSKRGLGRPVQASRTLDLSNLAGISLYEPDELVLRAGAGTPLASISKTLAEKRQHLAFEPGDWGSLYGAAAGRGTLGGAIAVNLSGPRRIKAGAARDHILGFTAVNGRGEAFKAGGRVMKNVTGYDLPKLMAGSHGTLAVLTEITVKVLPAPETTRTLLVLGLEDARAVSAMSQALGSAHEVSAAAHLPSLSAARSPVPQIAAARRPVTALRLEGPEPSTVYRLKVLGEELSGFGEIAALDSATSELFWNGLRDLQPFRDEPTRPLWRISVAPSEAPGLAAALSSRIAFDHFYDWGGGLLWLALPPGADTAAQIIRAAFARGHATLMRAEPSLRSQVPVFQPQAPALAELTRRIKESFDPLYLLNPGRMQAGL
ncbi:MAG TPA: glycolate oxidase subunit GlcE [Alphaproteobacteria bacterium]|nr:glycolate oxidase subunit GlcE [Alphaproteobacteria bacterium]